jgi:tetratricopeptide (TPR) repeat protein
MANSESPNKSARPVPAGASPSLAPRLGLLFLAPVAFFCGLEGVLRFAGYGKPTGLFIPAGKPGLYRTNPDFTIPFIPASFGIQPLNFSIQRHKEPGHIRVFVLGESAAQGIPDPDFGFAAQLRAQLRARIPGRQVEVYNLGITAINSHVVYQAARQLAGFEPDLLVIYMGNNEVVGPYGPGCAYLPVTPPLWFIRASVWVRGMRVGQLISGAWDRLAHLRQQPLEWKGMETFSDSAVRGDDPRLELVYRSYAANLRDILDVAGRSGVRTVLATLVANLRDSAPFVSLHRAGLGAGELGKWNAASQAGMIAADLGDATSALSGYADALEVDPQFADTLFRLGRLAESEGENASARRSYLGALHWDALRFRPDARLNEIVRAAAAQRAASVVLVDAARELGSDPASAGPIPGRDLLLDHVHFSWQGNFRMARLLADGCVAALPGAEARPGPSLDSGAVAAALGYTADARLKGLKVMVQLTLRPPFTNELTFSESQAGLKREVEEASAELAAPGAKAAAAASVERALAGDPDNASIAAHLASLESEAGDLARALSLIGLVESIEPGSAELSAQKARVLSQLGRYEEAQALLLSSVRLDERYYSAGTALVELWAGVRQFDEGRRFFARELARAPGNPYLRLEYANFLARCGDPKGAELQARAIWAGDPASRPAMAALELLVRLLEAQGRAAEAEALSLEARPRQPGDYFNNERVVRIYASRNDAAGVADALRALKASGPFDSAQHVDLAHRYADLGRSLDMLNELAEARETAAIEGDARQVRAIEETIGVYRQRFGASLSP